MSKTAYDGTGHYPGIADLTETERHRILADGRRRTLLDVLAAESTPMDLEDLATEVVRREVESERVDHSDVDRVATELYHNHIPKLEDRNVLEFDPEECRVVTDPIGTDD
jgi:hypothetical protein